MTRIATTTHATALSDLSRDAWHVVAIRQYDRALDVWAWTFPQDDVREFERLGGAGDILTTQRRDAGCTVLLAKLRGKK